MIKCQFCSATHETEADCRKPVAVLKHVRYKRMSFFVAEDDSYLQLYGMIRGVEMRGRKWRLSPHMTRSEIVQTAFMAALTWEEHECREAFHYRGQAVFGPHFHVEALVKLCEQGNLEVRS